MLGRWFPDLKGKTFVITGANSGLGFECARELGKKGASIIMACRSAQKAEAAKLELQKEVGGSVALDLADLSSVRKAADTVRKLTNKIDGLVNNAGVMQTPDTRTVDGFELQLAASRV
ncbi:short-chain dehydrogenase, partial [Loktanella sp. D2R18]|uniref:SDR family NAD(P)-dependent oxidoreductase n=1 Tax=Loktanella sp. D2R18 TaxID=2267230 RepID=UPI000DEAA2F9